MHKKMNKITSVKSFRVVYLFEVGSFKDAKCTSSKKIKKCQDICNSKFNNSKTNSKF